MRLPVMRAAVVAAQPAGAAEHSGAPVAAADSRTPAPTPIATRPGSVSVRVLGPHGPLTPSAVHVGPQSLTVDAHGAHGPVPAGTWRLTALAPDHLPREAVVDVERGREVHLDLALDHEQGLLDLDVEPRDATVFVDDVDHGSRLKGLPVDTGRHRLRVRHPGHYDRDLDWTVAAGQTRAGYVALPRALVWSRRETGTQYDDRSLGDLDGDGRDELLHRNFGKIFVFDPWTDREVWRAPNNPSRDVAQWVGDLDGDGRRDLALAEDLGGDVWRLAVWTADALLRPGSAPLWTRTGRKTRRPRHDRNRGLLLDLDGDRADDLVTALATPDVLAAHAGPSGRVLWQVPLGQVPEDLWADPDALRVFAVTDDRALAVDGRTGAVLWSVAAPPDAPVHLSRLASLGQSPHPGLLVARQRPGPRFELTARDGADGRPLWTRTWTHDPARDRTYLGLAPDAMFLSLGHETHVLDNATGATRWTAPIAERTSMFRHEPADPWIVTASGANGLVAHDLTDGSLAFERDLGGPATGPSFPFDWDGDGDHALAVARGDTISLFDRDGAREATLYLPDTSLASVTPIGDMDHDGGEDLSIRALGGPALVLGARVLWSRRGHRNSPTPTAAASSPTSTATQDPSSSPPSATAPSTSSTPAPAPSAGSIAATRTASKPPPSPPTSTATAARSCSSAATTTSSAPSAPPSSRPSPESNARAPAACLWRGVTPTFTEFVARLGLIAPTIS